MKIVNKTDNVIALYINGSWETFMPSGLSAKIKETLIPTDNQEIQISRYSYDGIIGLPDKEDDIIYVVDKIVAIRAWQLLRDDVVYMHQPLVRNDKYQAVASLTLVSWQNSRI